MVEFGNPVVLGVATRPVSVSGHVAKRPLHKLRPAWTRFAAPVPIPRAPCPAPITSLIQSSSWCMSYAPNVPPSSRPPCSSTAAILFGRQRDGPPGPTMPPSPYWWTLWHVFNVHRARRHGDDAGRYVHAHEPIPPAGMPGTPADVEGRRCHGGRGRRGAGATDHLDLYCDWTCRRRR
ncbi:hypothetical protein PBRA_002180 [Plasmodiophora brassicae]|uniref:Uncharacterized protein n=1 Tax=Plasmodiophora brassicae TaxID=37360 RepID=A0A0G4J2I1_PLABS|nr:hypothetical protein PBRA_002180 [Plasmodiophora brassicae]